MHAFSIMVLIPLLLSVSLVQLAALPSKPLHTTPPEDAWQAWLLFEQENKAEPVVDSYMLPRRRITPKSVFIVPNLSPDALPNCADGYQQDDFGKCVKLVKVNEAAHLQYLLNKLNNMYATESTGDSDEEYDYGDESDKTEPFQINIPFASPIIGDEVKKPTVEVTVTKKDVLPLVSTPAEITNTTENVGNKDILNDNSKNITDSKVEAVNTTITFLQPTEHKDTFPTTQESVHNEKANGSVVGNADLQNKDRPGILLNTETEKPTTGLPEETKTDVYDKLNSFLHKDDAVYNYTGTQIKVPDVSSASSYADIGDIDAIIDKIVPLPLTDDVASKGPSTQTDISVAAPANGKFETTDELESEILNLKHDKVPYETQPSYTIKKDTTESDLNDFTTEPDYDSTTYNEDQEGTTVAELNTEDSTDTENVEDSTTFKTSATILPESNEELPLTYVHKDTILVTRQGGGPITETDIFIPVTSQDNEHGLEESLEQEQLELLKNAKHVPKKPLREILPQHNFDEKLFTSVQPNAEELLNKDTDLFQSGSYNNEDKQKYVEQTNYNDENVKLGDVKRDSLVDNQKVDITKEVVPKDYVKFPDEIVSETRNSGFVKFPEPVKVIPPTNILVPKISEKPSTDRTSATANKPPFWWVPPGWEVDHSQQKPMLLRFWSRMPLVKDPAVFLPAPVTHRPTGIRQTSGHRGDGRYPSQQYYREVSAQDIYNVLGSKHWRNVRQHR